MSDLALALGAAGTALAIGVTVVVAYWQRSANKGDARQLAIDQQRSRLVSAWFDVQDACDEIFAAHVSGNGGEDALARLHRACDVVRKQLAELSFFDALDDELAAIVNRLEDRAAVVALNHDLRSALTESAPSDVGALLHDFLNAVKGDPCRRLPLEAAAR